MTAKTKSGKTSSTNMAETSMNYEACYEMYLKTFREELGRTGLGMSHVESNPAHQMYLDKIREMVGRYIDENDVELIGNDHLHHPVFSGCIWAMNYNLSKKAAILEALNEPDEQGKAQAVLKSAIKEEMLQYSLANIVLFGLWFPYNIYILKEAKEFMTKDDFSSLVSCCFSTSCYRLCAGAGVTKEDILEVFNACNPEKLSSEDIKSCLSVDCDDEITVYLDDEGDELNLSSTFSWMSSPKNVLNEYLDIYGEYADRGAYTAKINIADVLVYFRLSTYAVILNPDKLHDIEHVDEASDLCDEEELEEIDEAYANA